MNIAFQLNQISIWLAFMLPHGFGSLDLVDPEFSQDNKWIFRSTSKHDDELHEPCVRVHSSTRDLIKRFNSILPFFDKNHANVEFLRKFRATVYGMAEGEDLLDKEAAFYSAVITPVIFLQNYRDTWCLLERFHRSLRFYQISHPTEKRSSLKLLQNIRAVNNKIRNFISELPGLESKQRTSSTLSDMDDEELHDRKDIRYLKELIKNLG